MSLAVSPKITLTFETVSPRSLAALTASVPILIAIAPTAAATAAKAKAAFLLKSPTFVPKLSTSVVALLTPFLSEFRSASKVTVTFGIFAINLTRSL
jgi:uncharacterized membrane protein